MNDNSQILNAQIINVSLGYDDHGILTFGLTLVISDDTGCVFGGYSLDAYNKEAKERYCEPYSMEPITQIMKTVGVSKWEELKYKYIRVVSTGRSNSIKKIGNLMKDKWLDIDKFLEEHS